MGLAARALQLPEPSFDLEAELMDKYHGPVAGIDEAGRGPWAGPVVVAAVILNPDRIPEGLNDSKVLMPEAREDRYAAIMATAIVSVAIGPVRQIDRINILQASLWGMRAAYRRLRVPAGSALIDGNIVPFAPDAGSADLPLGTKAKYTASAWSFILDIASEEGKQSGTETINYPARLILRNDHDQIVFQSDGTAQCGS